MNENKLPYMVAVKMYDGTYRIIAAYPLHAKQDAENYRDLLGGDTILVVNNR